jgi:hypothetical protein
MAVIAIRKAPRRASRLPFVPPQSWHRRNKGLCLLRTLRTLVALRTRGSRRTDGGAPGSGEPNGWVRWAWGGGCALLTRAEPSKNAPDVNGSCSSGEWACTRSELGLSRVAAGATGATRPRSLAKCAAALPAGNSGSLSCPPTTAREVAWDTRSLHSREGMRARARAELAAVVRARGRAPSSQRGRRSAREQGLGGGVSFMELGCVASAHTPPRLVARVATVQARRRARARATVVLALLARVARVARRGRRVAT